MNCLIHDSMTAWMNCQVNYEKLVRPTCLFLTLFYPNCSLLDTYRASIFRAQEPKAPVTYCDHALSGVCRPSVRRLLDYLHFRLLLQNRLMDFDETWYGWSTQGPLQVLLFFGQIRPGADPGQGKNRSRGSPSSGNFFFRLEGYSNKPNA